MSTSTISKAEDHYRMKDLDETFEEKYVFIKVIKVIIFIVLLFVYSYLLHLTGTQN